MAQITLNSTGVASNGALVLQSNGTTAAVTVDTSQNVGVGVTPSAWGGTYKAIQLGSCGALETNNSNKYMAIASNHYNNGSGDLYIANGYATRYYQVDGTHVWNTAASGTAGNAISFTQAMTLAANTALLLGTTNDSAKVWFTNGASPESRLIIGQGTGAANTLDSYLGAGRNIIFETGSNERARIDSSGNVGIGTTSITSGGGWTPRLVLAASGAAPAWIIKGGSSQELSIGASDSMYIDCVGSTTGTNNNIIFRNTSTNSNFSAVERARIDSSGRLLVGTTSSTGNGGVIQAKTTTAAAALYAETNSSGGSQNVFDIANASNAAYVPVRFWVNGYAATQVGSISCTTTATTYGSGSDYRLKTVIGNVTGQGARIDALEPIEYTWNSNGTRTRGFLAHKFQEVYAESVTGEKDAVDENGKPVYQTMQAGTSEVIADLVAEIQSLRKRLAALESN
jgi:hypothetical protein